MSDRIGKRERENLMDRREGGRAMFNHLRSRIAELEAKIKELELELSLADNDLKYGE